VVATGDDVNADGAVGPVAIDRRLFIDELLDEPRRCDNNRCAGAELEREDSAVRFGPFEEPSVWLLEHFSDVSLGGGAYFK
jgi:hypothetical protein